MSKEKQQAGKKRRGTIHLHKFYKGIIALMGDEVVKSPFNPNGEKAKNIYKRMLVDLEYELRDRAASRFTQRSAIDEARE